MLFSSKYNFIYCKSIKTGSTSVEAALEYLIRGEKAPHRTHSLFYEDGSRIGCRGPNPEEDPNFNTKKFARDHASLSIIKDLIGTESFNSAVKISSIRNPYDRFISSYHWFGEQKLSETIEMRKNGNINSIKDNFANYINNHVTAKYNGRQHFSLGPKMVIDHFVRMEHMASDLIIVLKKLDVQSNIFDYVIENIPTFKKTPRSESSLQLSDYFTHETLEFVNEVCSDWFGLGGYTCAGTIGDLDKISSRDL